ncbi:Hypothetical protein A7982_01661 [Minicystis rosea]|nr:Hypothetical protein A7982_01661 [Minicystis rosea]
MGGCDTDGAAFGEAALADATGYCISNVAVDPVTIHFQGQQWLIGAAEGRGPRDLSVDVSEFIQPQISTNTSVKLDPNAVSDAVGYSVAARYQVRALSSITVSTGIFQRLEAYASYQRSDWEIKDAACLVHLGFGSTFKPIGVYFETVGGTNIALPDPGVYVPAPTIGGGLALGPAEPVDGGAAEPSDAGAPDSGASPPPQGSGG